MSETVTVQRQEKVKAVELFSQQLSTAKMVVFAEYKGLNVASMTTLRKKCRQSSVTFKVMKNTLALRAFKNPKAIEEWLGGPTGIAIGFDDPVLAAKALHEFAKENDKFKIKGGL